MPSNDGFLNAPQRSSIADQLAGGIRALLVDTKYGFSTSSGVVWTDLRGQDRTELVEDLGQETVASIEHLRATLVTTSQNPELFLCHHFLRARGDARRPCVHGHQGVPGDEPE